MAVGQDGGFKGRHFASEVILWALRWYLALPISYRDLSAMLADRGVTVWQPHLLLKKTLTPLNDAHQASFSCLPPSNRECSASPPFRLKIRLPCRVSAIFYRSRRFHPIRWNRVMIVNSESMY